MEIHSNKYRQLSLNISHYRKKTGLSQMQLAEKIGISRTHLSQIEAPNIIRAFSINVLFDIADTLEVETMKLFDFSK